MNPLYDQTFVGRELFYISFDYDKCMQDPFHNELYNIFRRAKIEDGDAGNFPLTFAVYLHAAYKACGYMMLDLDIYGPRAYHDLFIIAFRYMCVANEDDDYITWPDSGPDDHRLFCPAEVFLIEHLAYAILAAKANPSAPFQLIEVFENHLTIPADITECLTFFCDMCHMDPIPRVHSVEQLRDEWEPISHQLFAPIKEVAVRYSRKVTIDTQLYAHNIDSLSDWDCEDLTPWLTLPLTNLDGTCSQVVSNYDAEVAHRFLNHWEYLGELYNVVELIEEWSKENPEYFGNSLSGRRHKVGDTPSANLGFIEERRLGPDPEEQEKARAQAIDELYDYIEELSREENTADDNHAAPMPVAAPTQRPPIHLNLNGKEGLTKINVIRIFNVMHHLGFFVDADGQPMTKNALFAALSTAFNCPELNDWENSLYTSRSKANSDHKAQLKIFEKLKKNQKKFFAEQQKEMLEIFNLLQEEQETILAESDEKKRRNK